MVFKIKLVHYKLYKMKLKDKYHSELAFGLKFYLYLFIHLLKSK